MISSISVRESGSKVQNPVQVPATKNIPEHLLRPEHNRMQEHQKAEEKREKVDKIDNNLLKEQTDKLNQVMDLFNYSIRFSVDDESKRMVVKVVNSETKEVIRQIPPEETLQMMRRLDQVVGVILDEKV